MDWGRHEKLSARLVLLQSERCLVCLDAHAYKNKLKRWPGRLFRRRYSLFASLHSGELAGARIQIARRPLVPFVNRVVRWSTSHLTLAHRWGVWSAGSDALLALSCLRMAAQFSLCIDGLGRLQIVVYHRINNDGIRFPLGPSGSVRARLSFWQEISRS